MRKTRKLNRSSERVPMMTTEQLLKWVPISERTLHRYLAAGKLRAYKMDGLLLFNPADIEEFLKRRRVGGGPVAPFKEIEPGRRMTDAEVQAFFANCERDDEGNLISLTP